MAGEAQPLPPPGVAVDSSIPVFGVYSPISGDEPVDCAQIGPTDSYFPPVCDGIADEGEKAAESADESPALDITSPVLIPIFKSKNFPQEALAFLRTDPILIQLVDLITKGELDVVTLEVGTQISGNYGNFDITRTADKGEGNAFEYKEALLEFLYGTPQANLNVEYVIKVSKPNNTDSSSHVSSSVRCVKRQTSSGIILSVVEYEERRSDPEGIQKQLKITEYSPRYIELIEKKVRSTKSYKGPTEETVLQVAKSKEGEDGVTWTLSVKDKPAQSTNTGNNKQKTSKPTKQDKRQAEYDRLKDNLRNFARVNNWDGAERTYQEILALKNITIGYDVYLHGTGAAQNLGDVFSQYERSQLLLASNPPEGERVGAQNTLNDISTNYGRIEIILPRGSSYTLNMVTPPFSPAGRNAISFAQTQLTENGYFKGFLPITKDNNSYSLTLTETSTDATPFTFHLRTSMARQTDATFQRVEILTPPLMVTKPGPENGFPLMDELYTAEGDSLVLTDEERDFIGTDVATCWTITSQYLLDSSGYTNGGSVQIGDQNYTISSPEGSNVLTLTADSSSFNYTLKNEQDASTRKTVCTKINKTTGEVEAAVELHSDTMSSDGIKNQLIVVGHSSRHGEKPARIIFVESDVADTVPKWVDGFPFVDNKLKDSYELLTHVLNNPDQYEQNGSVNITSFGSYSVQVTHTPASRSKPEQLTAILTGAGSPPHTYRLEKTIENNSTTIRVIDTLDQNNEKSLTLVQSTDSTSLTQHTGTDASDITSTAAIVTTEAVNHVAILGIKIMDSEGKEGTGRWIISEIPEGREMTTHSEFVGLNYVNLNGNSIYHQLQVPPQYIQDWTNTRERTGPYLSDYTPQRVIRASSRPQTTEPEPEPQPEPQPETSSETQAPKKETNWVLSAGLTGGHRQLTLKSTGETFSGIDAGVRGRLGYRLWNRGLFHYEPALLVGLGSADLRNDTSTGVRDNHLDVDISPLSFSIGSDRRSVGLGLLVGGGFSVPTGGSMEMDDTGEPVHVDRIVRTPSIGGELHGSVGPIDGGVFYTRSAPGIVGSYENYPDVPQDSETIMSTGGAYALWRF